jgi:hypothetical protein
MAGIQVDADAVNILWEVNIKKRVREFRFNTAILGQCELHRTILEARVTAGSMQYRWVSYHIGQGGKQVEIEKVGAPESTWTEFIDSFPEDQCRYGGAVVLVQILETSMGVPEQALT